MILYTILNTVMFIALLIALGYLAFRIFCHFQGDENLVFLVNRRTPFKIEDISFNQLTLVTEIPFRNQGKQNGTIMDAFPRHLLPQEQFDAVHVESWLTNAHEERHDGYWKALIVEPGKGGKILLRVILTGKSGNIRTDGKEFPNMNIDVVYQMVGRSDWHIAKARLTLTHDEVVRALEV